jgi:hypothetical protein
MGSEKLIFLLSFKSFITNFTKHTAIFSCHDELAGTLTTLEASPLKNGL